MKVLRIFSATFVLALVLTGCGQADETVSEGKDTSNIAEQGVGNLKVSTDDVMLVKNTDGNSIIDPLEDETVDTLEGAPIELSYNISDVDGDASLHEDESYTVSLTVKNTGGKEMTMDDFKVYLQGA